MEIKLNFSFDKPTLNNRKYSKKILCDALDELWIHHLLIIKVRLFL